MGKTSRKIGKVERNRERKEDGRKSWRNRKERRNIGKGERKGEGQGSMRMRL